MRHGPTGTTLDMYAGHVHVANVMTSPSVPGESPVIDLGSCQLPSSASCEAEGVFTSDQDNICPRQWLEAVYLSQIPDLTSCSYRSTPCKPPPTSSRCPLRPSHERTAILPILSATSPLSLPLSLPLALLAVKGSPRLSSQRRRSWGSRLSKLEGTFYRGWLKLPPQVASIEP